MDELRGVDYLRRKLLQKAIRNKERYIYYEMKNHVLDFNISTPASLRYLNYSLGWCGKAVDSLADRIVFKGFTGDNFNIDSIFDMNNRDVLFDSAVLSALITACCFIYISPGDDGFPRLRVIDGRNATGILDPITNLLKEGYAVLERDDIGIPSIEAYFTPDYTEIIQGKSTRRYDNPALYPLLVPIIFRPDAKREFGHSRISRACMGILQSASRTIKRSEVTAEFYSFPQRYIAGMDQDQDLDAWKSAIDYFLIIDGDSSGKNPTIGQFQQQTMEPHISQLRMFAALFAGETGLTLDDLGFATDNPSSAEAIKASHENLRLTARKAQRTFGTGFLNVGYLAASVRDNMPYRRNQLCQTVPTWQPIFEPDAAMLSGIGDAVGKINAEIPGFFSPESLEHYTGIKAGV